MTYGKPLDGDPIEGARRHWVSRGWESAADGMAAATSVFRAQQILVRRVEVLLRPMGLGFARYEVLALLSFTRTGALPMTKMGTLLQVHPTSVTSAVDRLESHGLVERRRHPTDRRAVLACITAKGRETARRATDVLNREVFEDLGISDAEMRKLGDVLRTLRLDAGDF